MIVADPTAGDAELLAGQCERLAETRHIATSVREVEELLARQQPELLVLSLELKGAALEAFIAKLQKTTDGPLVIVTYRELSVPRMEELAGLGLEDFVPHPADALQIFRAASRRFHMPFRRHDRFSVTMDVSRADGVAVGRSIDISEGGLCMSAQHPLVEGESILVDLPLPDAVKPLRVRCNILRVEGQAPTPVTVRMQFARLRGREHRRLVTYLAELAKTTKP